LLLLARMKTPVITSEQRNRADLLSLVGQHLDRLYRFVLHELGYLQAVGDVMPGELTPEDVVDATLLRAYRELVKVPPGREIGGRLIQLAIEQLEADVKRLKSERDRTVHIEQGVPETPPAEQVSTLGDEILDFYEPDEDLKLEDIIADLSIPTPEQEAEIRELRRCVRMALTGLPREWRRALLLCHVEGLTGAELARSMGRAEPETERILEHAREYLRQRLLEAGCRPRE
jgi:RNA polymerase sigma factor (sigma-70 family)